MPSFWIDFARQERLFDVCLRTRTRTFFCPVDSLDKTPLKGGVVCPMTGLDRNIGVQWTCPLTSESNAASFQENEMLGVTLDNFVNRVLLNIEFRGQFLDRHRAVFQNRVQSLFDRHFFGDS